MDDALAADAGLLTDWELEAAVVAAARLEARVAALRLGLAAEAERRGAAAATGAAGTAAWLGNLTGDGRAAAAGGVRIGRLLAESYEATRAAFASGRVNLDQVRVIVNAAERLPVQVTAEQRSRCEETLVAKAAAGMNAKRLRVAARRMLEVIDTDLADAHESDELQREEKRAELETWLTCHDNGDGTHAGRFTIPTTYAKVLLAQLDRRTAPRRRTRDRSGSPVVDESVPWEAMSWSEHLGLAFLELIDHLPTDGDQHVAATMVVHLDLDALLSGIGAGTLDNGERISAAEARRLACGAGIIPMVLGGESQPLDVGRERRLHTKAQRIALSHLHDRCVVVGCDRAFAWCEIHHRDPWSAGGRTDLASAQPLCGYHHRRAHDRAYDMRTHADGSVRFRRRT